MNLTFQVVPKGTSLATKGSPNVVILEADNWDDYHFKTFFSLYLYDESGFLHELGGLRIGFKGQEAGYTKDYISQTFLALDDRFFSLGSGVEYYTDLRDKLSEEVLKNILTTLRDVAYDPSIIESIRNEAVFRSSLLRNAQLSVVTGQYNRILKGGAVLTPFHFSYQKPKSDKHSGIYVEFNVDPDSTPSSNIHVLIGRNGVGKTSLLNDMVKSALNTDPNNYSLFGYFLDKTNSDILGNGGSVIKANSGYFSGVISVSFSAFDPFIPPREQADRTLGFCYNYIGLKDQNEQSGRHKDPKELARDFLESLKICLQIDSKRRLWERAIATLESDPNFAGMDLRRIIKEDGPNAHKFSNLEIAHILFKKMSSGHGIVLLTITKLVEKVEEKTLILLDEPESHLHPPLLSAFMRSLSDLLESRNGIAIIATHSPVVLQEVPRLCVAILDRYGLEMTVSYPEIETFAENVGILTREVFRLEVSRSGFHSLLAKAVDEGKSLETIMAEYKGQIGFEGRAIIQSLINNEGKESKH